MRIATFNLENLDEQSSNPTLGDRIAIMKPQLKRIQADILCLQEVNSQEDSNGIRSFTALDSLLSGTIYQAYDRISTTTTSDEPYAERNLLILSRLPFISHEMIRDASGPQPSYRIVTADPPETAAKDIRWERPLLYAKINWEGTTLHVINVHMKSKLPTAIPGRKIDNFTWSTVSSWAEGSFISAMKRLGQSLQARLLIDDLFDSEGSDASILICGDFNADVSEVPLKAIIGPVEETGNPDHSFRIMIPCENNIPESSRYSLFHLGKGVMLDHILASRNMIKYFTGSEIHNEALPDESGAFRTDRKFPESDHAPVVAEFRSPNALL